ncbi:acyl-CoA dehydratase activase-related protein [Raoultibacter massiliensis]|uniref:Acyl-CoA dehydratase activase-related protein n=1 Tax=Raoultibacter massiliensis TaxID=1852371 RepID=A0ABV1J8N7_9ACTN
MMASGPERGALRLGIDLGSKTVKLAVLDEAGRLLHSSYERHLSNVQETLRYTISNAIPHFPDAEMAVAVSGSAGMQLAEILGLPFVQEVIAARAAVRRRIPEADVAIEIGGEDSKILFLSGSEELRMNNTCAGGTGGFIDTIAGMLDVNAEALNVLAHGCKKIYPIASRCAVFAQMDVRPLLNAGASKEDIAGSAFDAVATQCIVGLACGRPIVGRVALLGGPLHFLSALRDRFKAKLGLGDDDVVVPSDGHLFVAEGAALCGGGETTVTLGGLRDRLDDVSLRQGYSLERLDPLFASEEERAEFVQRHSRCTAPRSDLRSASGRVFLGIDSGSEAIKYVLIDEQGRILRSYYKRSAGDVVEAAREMLIDLWRSIPRKHDGTPTVRIAHATVTGYGEALLKRAFALDSGEVETVAHVRAAQELAFDVDFILDIGGQDIKCVWLRGGAISDLVLNEACSSGCGALISGMAWSMNVRMERFLEEAMRAEHPVDLGTRCTVFMTSRVRHAQKEGASVGEIAAGLAYSVVKNAVYKVIRVQDASMLGRRIVVQGGTFANDAVLRAFEKVYGADVCRPDIAAYMGAYGAALIARERAGEDGASTLLDQSRVRRLECVKARKRCEICGNACPLTVVEFADGDAVRRFIVGNRCERPLGEPSAKSLYPELFSSQVQRLFSYGSLSKSKARRGEIGLVRALGMYDLYPFWFTFFTSLGFRVEPSDLAASSRTGRWLESIPSESLCHPAKLMHAHTADLVDRGVRTVFLPYIDAVHKGKRNCPIVAGYPLVLSTNMDCIAGKGVRLISPHLPALLDGGGADGRLAPLLADAFGIPVGEVEQALGAAKRELLRYRVDIAALGDETLRYMGKSGKPAVLLAGRPYHCDPVVNHGIPELIRSFGFAVLTVDSVAHLDGRAARGDGALGGSWEYPEAIVAAARFAAAREDIEFVLLYSFGCGLDAAMVDEIGAIMRERGRTLTALKVDEMVDLAAVRIRIRSMIAARNGLFSGGARQ